MGLYSPIHVNFTWMARLSGGGEGRGSHEFYVDEIIHSCSFSTDCHVQSNEMLIARIVPFYPFSTGRIMQSHVFSTNGTVKPYTISLDRFRPSHISIHYFLQSHEFRMDRIRQSYLFFTEGFHNHVKVSWPGVYIPMCSP